METKSKTSLAETEAKLVENINKLPVWARPIALKYLEQYRQAVKKVQPLDPETFNECITESKRIVEEMVEEMKQEAIRHGWPFKAMRGGGAPADGSHTPSGPRNKQLKN